MSFKKLLNDIDPNNTAFLIGNGINYYAGINEDCNKCKDKNNCEDSPKSEFKCAWTDLLQELCDEYQIPIKTKKLKDITLPELASLAEIKFGSDSGQTALNSIAQFKRKLIQKIENYQFKHDQHPIYRRFLHYAKKNNIPVITTNYDMLLSQDLKENRLVFQDKTFFKSNDSYIWNYCYSDTLFAPSEDNYSTLVNGFGVWHIHGNTKHHRSIKIGLDDYINCCSKTKALISKGSADSTFTPLFELNPNIWIGRNTLLDIVFHKNLIILGLSLDSQEVFLRWLFIQRKSICAKIKGSISSVMLGM